MALILKSSQEVLLDIAKRVKTMRLKQNLTQMGLSVRSGVSLGTLKKFERTGEISLKSLIDISIALGAMSDFEKLFSPDDTIPQSLFNTKETKIRKRGSIK